MCLPCLLGLSCLLYMLVAFGALAVAVFAVFAMFVLFVFASVFFNMYTSKEIRLGGHPSSPFVENTALECLHPSSFI